eukprot:CAMPEP_0185848006 /NCGR_PEP_ID=MMETSP1354-20130828/3041_1 /TAXON_ID=708628 /ORGANISM="Erythrolobus madagascarensis, Strain CCMP3276" /LENGTH=107 /DNA_ID=CAMNT_0028548347 /DNA_START=919 /DNA_END=1242 /DNA_ORIENTATION=-
MSSSSRNDGNKDDIVSLVPTLLVPLESSEPKTTGSETYRRNGIIARCCSLSEGSGRSGERGAPEAAPAWMGGRRLDESRNARGPEDDDPPLQHLSRESLLIAFRCGA